MQVFLSAMRGIKARNIARDADLFVVRVPDHGVVRRVGPVLEVGPGASPDAVVTIACRRQLEIDGVPHDERLVARRVEALGYEYAPTVASGLFAAVAAVS